MDNKTEQDDFERLIKAITALNGAEVFFGAFLASAFIFVWWFVTFVTTRGLDDDEILGCPTTLYRGKTYVKAVPECVHMLNMLVNEAEK